MDTARQNIRIQTWIAVLSLTLLAIKLLAYYLTNSVAILTDALEGIVNVIAGFFGLYSLRLSAKPRDADHPYGHGKVEFISAAIEGSLIFIAGILIIFEAVRNLIDPPNIHQLDIGIVLISITAAINFIAGTGCVRAGKRNNSPALIASGKHLQTDAYTTLGILTGIALIYFTNVVLLDSVVAILFSLIILYTGYKIIRSSVAGIMDETDRQLLSKIVAVLNVKRRENWIDLHNARFIKYGSVLHLDAHLTVPWYLNVHEAHNEIDAFGKLIRKELNRPLELFIHTDGCMEFSCKICHKHDCPVRQHNLENKIEWTVENISRDKKHTIENKQMKFIPRNVNLFR